MSLVKSLQLIFHWNLVADQMWGPLPIKRLASRIQKECSALVWLDKCSNNAMINAIAEVFAEILNWLLFVQNTAIRIIEFDNSYFMRSLSWLENVFDKLFCFI